MIALLIVTFTNCTTKISSVKISKLTCENQINPIGIDITEPLLSWMIESKTRGEKQTAYQVLAASSLDLLAKDQADLWDSKMQTSEQSVLIKYAGKPLETGMKCFWKVRIWDKDKNVSAWSEPAQWSMGLLKTTDWQAKWIGIDTIFNGEDNKGEYRKLAARYLRKEFNVSKEIKTATGYISGLGLYELWLNGTKTGNMVLAPGATQYNTTVFYNTFDITSQLTSGKNAIGVILGNGRYFAMRKDVPFKMRNYGYPKLIMQIEIEYKDGSKDLIISDESWKLTAKGPITENSEFDGEKYDARLEMNGWDKAGFDDSKWLGAQLVSVPSGKLVAQPNEPIRVTGQIKPISVKQLSPGVYIFDMGQNMVGWASLKAKGNKGDKITLRFGEILKKDGSLYTDNMRSAKVTDSYIFKGDEDITWEPKFTYHGFRYVELTGMKSTPDLNTLTGCVVNDDLATTGSFECSNPTINKVYKNATWGLRGNYRSFPTDCPQRDERMGWYGDRSICCRGETYIFNIGSLYRKWLGDMRDDQTEEGGFSDMSPAYWYMHNDNVTYNGAGIVLSEMLFDQYGNFNVVEENYEAMKKWLLYMNKKYGVKGIMNRDTWGDWVTPPEDSTLVHTKDPNRRTAINVLGTSFFYFETRIMQRFAKLLAKPEDEKLFDSLATEIKAGFNLHFYESKSNYYGNNTATANILALAFDLVPQDKKQDVFNSLVEKIEVENKGRVCVGLMGIKNLLRVLTDFGRADLAVRIASETQYPSWGYMANNGATTIWELWNGNTADPSMNSGNHPGLLGDLLIWLHEYVAGIKAAEPGFKSIIMKPLISDSITYAKATHHSPYGTIVSNWELNKNMDFVWDIQIPANSKATVYIPAMDENSVSESDKIASQSEGVSFVEYKNGFAVYEVLSGVYHFVSKGVKLEKTNFEVSKRVTFLPNDTSSASPIKIVMNCKDSDAEIRYTLDGSTPTETSNKYTAPFEISKTTMVKARSFRSSVKPSLVTCKAYDIYNSAVNGLNFEYFDGKWETIPDYSSIKPLKTGKVNGFLLNKIKTKEDYWGIRFKGFIEIQKDGVYTFYTISDDGTRLYINNKLIVDNDGIHGTFTAEGKIELKKGKYPFMLDYFEGNYGEVLRVEVEGPEIQKQVLPVSMLFFE